MALNTRRSHASLQLNRNTVSEITESKNPWREGALEGYRRRNAALDALFYDVGKVTPAEAALIAPWLAQEGALLIVPPSGQGSLTLCAGLNDFEEKGGRDIHALTVAGVGSSALGSAAFARNLADAIGAPVAALVSGYGLADLMAEACGGWFWFGAVNNFRHQFEVFDNKYHEKPDLDSGALTLAPASSQKIARRSLDTRMLIGLLSDKRFTFDLLSGHSKGNYVISEALYSLDTVAANRLDAITNIVTVSATISMPRHYQKVFDIIGQWDWFGGLNSRPGIKAERTMPRAWHHTNTELPWHLPVTEVFKGLLASGDLVLKAH